MSGALKLSNGKSASNLLVDNPSSLSGAWMLKVSHVNAGYDSSATELSTFKALDQDSNGNIFVLTQMNNNRTDARNPVITKYTKTGIKLWSKHMYINYSGGSSFSANDVIVDSAGDCYVLANTTTLHKLSGTDGSYIWGRSFSGSSLNMRQLGIDSSNNIYVCGTITYGTGDSHCIVKISSSNVIAWTNSMDTGNQDNCNGGWTDSSGNTFTFGYTTNLPQAGYFKTTSAGSSSGAYYYTYPTYAAGASLIYSMTGDSSGNLYFAGYQVVAAGQTTGQIMKTNSSGVKTWNRQLRAGTNTSWFYDVAVDASGNVYGVGKCLNAVGSSQLSPVIVKWDSAGTLQWQREIIVPSTNSAMATYIDSVIVDKTDSNYIIISYRYMDAIDGAGKHLIARLPVDGTKTGSYRIKVTDNDNQTIVYQAASNTESAGTWNGTTQSLSQQNSSQISNSAYTGQSQEVVQLIYGKASV